METPLRQYLSEAKPYLEEFLADKKPVAALILGSGLNPYADALEDSSVLPYKQIPHMKVSSATGHKGQFVLGRVSGTEDTWVLCMQGRLHGYEGCTAREVAFPVWLMQSVGIPTLVTTNAVGAINPNFKVGSFCAMTDHINFTGRNPIVGIEPNLMDERFVPMLNAYDPNLRELLQIASKETNVEVNEGVYLGLN